MLRRNYVVLARCGWCAPLPSNRVLFYAPHSTPRPPGVPIAPLIMARYVSRPFCCMVDRSFLQAEEANPGLVHELIDCILESEQAKGGEESIEKLLRVADRELDGILFLPLLRSLLCSVVCVRHCYCKWLAASIFGRVVVPHGCLARLHEAANSFEAE